MKVTVDNKTYRVYWRHLAGLKGIHENVSFNGITECRVEPPDGASEAKVLLGEAFCSLKDRFNKEKGRKVSLSRALDVFPKDIRKKFWETYGKEIGAFANGS